MCPECHFLNCHTSWNTKLALTVTYLLKELRGVFCLFFKSPLYWNITFYKHIWVHLSKVFPPLPRTLISHKRYHLPRLFHKQQRGGIWPSVRRWQMKLCQNQRVTLADVWKNDALCGLPGGTSASHSANAAHQPPSMLCQDSVPLAALSSFGTSVKLHHPCGALISSSVIMG